MEVQELYKVLSKIALSDVAVQQSKATPFLPSFDLQGECQEIQATVSKLQDVQAQRFALDLKACPGS